MLKVNEIFKSIQGESSYVGLPCAFVRLTGCHLRCSWCDTSYAFYEGTDMSVEEVLQKVEAMVSPPLDRPKAGSEIPPSYPSAILIGSPEGSEKGLISPGETTRGGMGVKLFELTGGEPLLQEDAFELVSRLCDLDYTVLIETSGAVDLSPLDPRSIKIMDIKCPSSGMTDKMIWENLDHLSSRDEVKFVIKDRMDFDWAKDIIEKYRLAEKVRLLFSPVFHELEPQQLAEWILEQSLPVRMQLQIHKYIWSPETRGV